MSPLRVVAIGGWVSTLLLQLADVISYTIRGLDTGVFLACFGVLVAGLQVVVATHAPGD